MIEGFRLRLDSRQEFGEAYFEAEGEDLHGGERDRLSSALDVADVAAIDSEFASHADLSEFPFNSELSQARTESSADVAVNLWGDRLSSGCGLCSMV